MSNTRASTIPFFMLAIVLIVHGHCLAQTASPETWGKPAETGTVVRFFYLPPESYAHPPLIFRVTSPGDKRLGSAPIVNMGGRTPYISSEEMENLIQGLKHTGLTWKQSTSAKLVSPIPTREMTDRMEISIFFTDHPTQAHVSPSELCQTLSGLDKVFIQARALWEFQLFRVEYSCTVPGFNRDAFPQHDDLTRDKE